MDNYRQFLLTDQVGTLRAVADSAGMIVKRIDYDSFGNIISDSNSAFSVPFGFAGGLHDRDIGLVRFGARDYDPAIGRWTAKDPLDFGGGDTNLYNYVLGDPVNLVDPSGEVLPFVVMGVGAVAGGVSNYFAMKDTLHGVDLAKSVLFGSALGAAGALIPGGIIAGTLSGAGASVVNDLNNQMLGSSCGINSSQVGSALLNGLAGGAIGSISSKVGGAVLNPIKNAEKALPKNHPYDLTGKALPPSTYGNYGAAAGIVFGSFGWF